MPDLQEKNRRETNQGQIKCPIHTAQALKRVSEPYPHAPSRARVSEEPQESVQQEREPLVGKDLKADELVDIPGVKRVQHAGNEGSGVVSRQFAAE